ncbi:MAG: metallophosphoesterase [Oscillospiraceae bacterium]|nr:metallophosphoesterase [Oscillospiraceae bacterium]
MVYVTGDMHGDYSRFAGPEMRKLKKGDTLIVCGDFGFLWNDSPSEKTLLKKIGKKRYNVCFVEGTHENFELLLQYPTSEWNGGLARQISGNLYHLARGQIFTIEGKTIFTMGGGVSPDGDFRAYDDNHMHWELPSYEELAAATELLEKFDGSVDYVVTHEPPARMRSFLQLKNKSAVTEASVLNTYFEELSKICTYKCWYFGSLHIDKFASHTYTSVFRKVVPIERA